MAMSHGLPVIASDLPANKEVIEHEENGLLFASEDSSSLAENITSFFNNSELSKKMIENATITIEKHYNWNNITKKYIELITKLKEDIPLDNQSNQARQ